MHRSAVATVALVGLVSSTPLLACGDKLFLIGLNQRFSDVYAAVRPGAIVIYTQGAVPKPNQHLRDPRLHKVLRRAGHKLVLASNPRELSELLADGTVDVVLTLDGIAETIESAVTSASSRPALLSVALDKPQVRSSMGPADRTVERAKVTKAKGTHVYSAIEETMKARAEAGLWRDRR